MPLLAKELAEQSGRKRTYQLRMLFALVLYAPALCTVLFSGRTYGSNPNFRGAIAQTQALGRDLAETLLFTLLVCVYMFLPAMMAGAIAAEKENGSLQLLFLTDLKPREMILQKYLGRLIPFLSLVLLALPMFACCYAYGGLTVDTVAVMGYGLLITMLQVAAIAIYCSARSSTVTGATVATYFLGAAFCFGPLLLGWMFAATLWWLGISGFRMNDDFWFSLLAFYVVGDNLHDMGDLFVASIPILASIVVFLALARRAMVRCVFTPPRSVLSVFRRMDDVFAAWNRRIGNITLLADKNSLPADRPVAWREENKRGLGRRHHRVRLLLMLMIPLVFFLVMSLTDHHYESHIILTAVAWLVCGILLVASAASCIPVERTNQTLEVLLSTPMDSMAIAREKLASVRGLGRVLSIPLLTLAIVPAMGIRNDYWNDEQYYWILYVVGTLAGLQYLIWIGFTCGLLIRKRTAAVLTAIFAAIFVFVGFPLLLALFIDSVLGIHDSALNAVFLFSPGIPILGGILHGLWRELFGDLAVFAACIWVVVAFLNIRSLKNFCFNRVSRVLRGE